MFLFILLQKALYIAVEGKFLRVSDVHDFQ